MTAIAEATPEPTPCPHCDGTGVQGVTYIRDMADTMWACEFCEGTGYLPTCYDCGAFLELVRPGSFQCPNCG